MKDIFREYEGQKKIIIIVIATRQLQSSIFINPVKAFVSRLISWNNG